MESLIPFLLRHFIPPGVSSRKQNTLTWNGYLLEKIVLTNELELEERPQKGVLWKVMKFRS